jgi:hypothetical protein
MLGQKLEVIAIQEHFNMATLTNLTVNGNLTGADYVRDINSDISEWQKISHCICDGSAYSDCLGTGYPYLHVRTPWSAEDFGGMGWNPYMFEVVGYHTYSGEYWHDFRAIVNTTGDGNNSFYGSQVRVNRGNANSSPVVYRSTNTYGGHRRLCFSVGKMSCCCTGYFWARAWTNAGGRTSYPWATFHKSDQANYF